MPHLDNYEGEGLEDEPEEGSFGAEADARVRAEEDLNRRDRLAAGQLPDAFNGALPPSVSPVLAPCSPLVCPVFAPCSRPVLLSFCARASYPGMPMERYTRFVYCAS